MNNKKIEAGLNRAIENITPNVYENILAVPVRKMRAHDHISMQTIRPIRRSYSFQMATVFALFVVVIGIFIGWSQFFQVYGVVDLDVNPSIELTINRQNRVIQAKPLNLDGVSILSEMNLKNVKVENAIDAILGSMIQQGYLTTQEDAILVSVLMNEESQARELENTIVIRMDQFFGIQSAPKVYSQNLRNQQALTDLARQYQVSAGVINLVQTVLRNNPEYSVEDLVNLPIKQLYLLAYEEDFDDLDDQDDEFDDDDRPDNGNGGQLITPSTPTDDDDMDDGDDQDDLDDDDYDFDDDIHDDDDDDDD